MRLFTFCSYLITKESYNWWITRRKWGFRHQISEAKNLKMLVANIWKHSKDFACVQDGCEISQPKANFAAITLWFRSLRNWPSTWCDWLPMALTSSFQLRFVLRLKRWIADFLSFETTYSMHQMDSRKCCKSIKQLMSSWILHVRFVSLLSSLHSWFHRALLNLGLLWWSNYYQNHQKLHNFIRNDCKGT